MSDNQLRSRMAFALGCILACLLAACGRESGRPAAPPDGGATPQAVVDGLREAVEADDIVRFCALVLPDQRALLSFGMAVFPVKRIVELSEAMLPASAAAGPDELMRAKARVEAMKKERAALLSKFAIDLGDDKAMAGQVGTSAAMQEALREKMGHVDHAAFILESRRFLEQHSPGEAKQPPVLAGFSTKLGSPTVAGETATVAIEGAAKPLGLVKHDGRWYVDLTTVK